MPQENKLENIWNNQMEIQEITKTIQYNKTLKYTKFQSSK